MTLQTSIGAGTFSAVCIANTAVTAVPANQAAFEAMFATTADYTQLEHIREMPPFGAPANVVKVPEFGRQQSVSIGAQSDAPDLSFTINYVPSLWVAGQNLYDHMAANNQVVFQFSLLYAKPADYTTTAGGLGAVDNSNIYFVGKLESLEVNPSLSDANTATLAVSIQSDFFGPYTIAAV